ncbi:hypothetical protein pdam_00024796 [Pocillopora damicornis]|uniref:Uncharacterized protein n=1 Tax=Pocillopora damicornis TaxID=46731 RepID=A0A3M6UN92_POCDA|nr:hypothetical protein pdam_00024796 [Pocillopora damicornis]
MSLSPLQVSSQKPTNSLKVDMNQIAQIMRKEAVRVSMIDLNFVKKFLTDMQSKLLEHKDNGPVEFISESEYCGPFAKK